MKKKRTITIPKTLDNYLKKKAKQYDRPVSALITIILDEYLYEYEDNYPWEEIRKEI